MTTRKRIFHTVGLLLNVILLILAFGTLNAEHAMPKKPRFEGEIHIQDTKYMFKVNHGQTVEDAATLFGKEHNLEKHLVEELIGDMMEHLASSNNNNNNNNNNDNNNNGGGGDTAAPTSC